jgi:alpha,alpha-trehalase
VVIDTSLCKAVIFDMDGVVTDSVPAHRQAWQEAFDAFLDEIGSDAPRFDEADYLTYVDGKPRYDGVRNFLASRAIELPFGSPEDPPDAMTVCGVGNRKNKRFLELLAEGGVEAFQSTLDLIARLRAAGRGGGPDHLEPQRRGRAGLGRSGSDDFPAIVDGNECSRLGLPGKPDPAVFHEAARRLGAELADAVVVEDVVARGQPKNLEEAGGRPCARLSSDLDVAAFGRFAVLCCSSGMRS